MASFWDDFKDVFKTDSQKAEERNKKIAEALKKEEEVAKRLKELESQYSQSPEMKEEKPNLDELFPKDSGLQEKKYVEPTDEELSGLATKEVENKKNADKSKLEEKFEKEFGAVDSEEEAETSLKEKYKKLDELYKSLGEKTSQNAIKNGIARSSIVLEQMEGLDEKKQLEQRTADNDYSDAIATINHEIERLNESKTQALDQLDLKYAVELDKRMADLKNERANTILKYEKYNNTVREKNIKYNQERESDISKFLKKQEKDKLEKSAAKSEYEKLYGYSGEKLDNYKRRYNIALDFYSSLSPDIAEQALESSPTMKYYLGEYYNKLKTALDTKGGETKRYF
ncbi:MAG: hypothetical protein RSA24_04305 [Clostridia bacterium]